MKMKGDDYMFQPTAFSNVVEMLFMHKNDDTVAIVQDNRKITYRQLCLETQRVADLLPNEKIIAVHLNNSIEFVIVFFAIALKKSVALILNKEMTQNELQNVLLKLKVNCVVTVNELIDKFSLLYNSFLKYKEIDIMKKKDAEQESMKDMTDIMTILPTSGTTSQSKMVQLSHRALLWGVKHTIQLVPENERGNELIVLAFSTRTALEGQLLTGIFEGKTMYLFTNRFNPCMFISHVNKFHIKHTSLVPSMVNTLLFTMRKKVTETQLESITVVGEKMNCYCIEQFIKYFPNVVLLFGYGMTEAGTITFRDKDNYADKQEHVGHIKSLNGIEIVIWDLNQDKKCCIGQIGEIKVCTPDMFSGYYEYNDENFDGKWLKTGDMGFIDVNGNLHITGRKKNIINVGGKKVFPEEVERIIQQYDGVKEVIVYGKNEKWVGEKLVANIVLEDNANFQSKDIITYCKEYLSQFKIPQEIYFVETINRTLSHKIARNIVGTPSLGNK